MPAGAKPGERRGGRAKGAANKITRDLREMILSALEGAGGQKYLQQQAKENPGPFLSLIGKCLPKDITVAGQLGTYAAQPIPVERRQSDSLASAAGPATPRDPK